MPSPVSTLTGSTRSSWPPRFAGTGENTAYWTKDVTLAKDVSQAATTPRPS